MNRREAGSVLMEFLLVLPIYFALLGGVFQTGELLLSRTNSLISDRVAAAAAASRYDETYRSIGGYLNSFLLGSRSGNYIRSVAIYEYLPHPDYSWSGTLGSKVSITVPTPSWVAGWLSYNGAILNNESTSEHAKTYTLMSRIGQKYNYVSFMRTKKGETGYRSLHPGELCYEAGLLPVVNSVWYKYVYQEKFASHDKDNMNLKSGAPAGQSRAKINFSDRDQKDYKRFPTYVLWGQ